MIYGEVTTKLPAPMAELTAEPTLTCVRSGHRVSLSDPRHRRFFGLNGGKGQSMARAGAFLLDSGDKFPQLAMETVRHGPLRLPDAFGPDWGVFLVYRAHW